MVTKTTYPSIKRFGARYGRTVKEKLGAAESSYYHKKQSCPYCNYIQVKRISSGIWHCKKCLAKFTSKAYSVAKKRTKVVEEGIAEEIPEEEIEDEENILSAGEEEEEVEYQKIPEKKEEPEENPNQEIQT
ncbi:hypothetical protein ACFL0W_02490 [Nanoarchaeota archaeon]